MIYGLGTDIIQIERVRGVMARTGGRFAQKVLGPRELEKYHARLARSEKRGLAFLATRFAAKEAFSKAIGLGMRWPMTWRAMELLNLPSGEPVAQCSGELAEWMRARGLAVRVSVSDEQDYAVAFAIAERVADGAARATEPEQDTP
ncbi:holo-ACP synthase [Cupriavidus sp. USMAA2-4]|uniref:holo-ACP synthase n=1 Tax=unclassified Cupriavidus TaxID=2640874 RepID=UPI0008A6B473|nr:MULTISPECIES: holo-ACP synthase [unclassified Cupriavidus]AOY93386.1 holo-ACP synthase [Cupriavidus sp. USMAA2-4]AOZ00322.1 holo-ACP synthase [Cupriavidus sp. USMAHM13]